MLLGEAEGNTMSRSIASGMTIPRGHRSSVHQEIFHTAKVLSGEVTSLQKTQSGAAEAMHIICVA